MRIPATGRKAVALLATAATAALVTIACNGGDPTPIPATPAPPPTAAATVMPTATSAKTAAPTAAPTAVPAATPTPVPTATVAPTAQAAETPAPTATPPAPTATPPSEETGQGQPPWDETHAQTETRMAAEAAVLLYKEQGPQSAITHYQDADSVDGQRFVAIIEQDSGTLLAMPYFPQLWGKAHPYFLRFTRNATGDGLWLEHWGITLSRSEAGDYSKEEPVLSYSILHDGLVFAASHPRDLERRAEETQERVREAIELYESEGPERTAAHYNSRESADGSGYTFIINEEGRYVAHPIFPHLVGAMLSEVLDAEGYPVGAELAQATGDGDWTSYVWPNPETGIKERKVAYAVRHEGLIFVSGYYHSDRQPAPPPWEGIDPEEYTITYVEEAVALYAEKGMRELELRYNGIGSFHGQWYLFATDENDIYIIHPLIPELIGTDIKDVTGPGGFPLGAELAKATEEQGVWVEYPWPYPKTLEERTKLGYAVRHEGMLFASGYYPEQDEPAGESETPTPEP